MDWSQVKKNHIEEAIAKFIEERPEHPEPRSYYLMYDGEKLPSKYIRGMAYSIATGEEFTLDGFSGGKETVRFFKKHGYLVEQAGINETPKYKVNDAVWLATALMAAEVYSNNSNISKEDMYFKQSDIIVRAQTLTTDKVDSARVSWWVNADQEKHTHKYLRADLESDGSKRRLTMIDEFPEDTHPLGLDMDDKLAMDENEITLEELFYFVKEQYPSVITNEQNENFKMNLDKTVQFVADYNKKRYIKPEKAGEKADEMRTFYNRGVEARKQMLVYAEAVAKHFPDMEVQGCTNWINAGQRCPGYLWVELKKKGYESQVHSISVCAQESLENDENIKQIISFRVEAKDVNCSVEDYQRHNTLVDIVIPEQSGIFYQATKHDNKTYDYDTDQNKAKHDIENEEVRKLKVVKAISKPYNSERNQELINEGIEAVKMLILFYEHIIAQCTDEMNIFWPSLDEYNPELTKEDWLKYLIEIEIPEHPSPMKMLKGMMELGGEASCKLLSDTYGGSPNAYIGCTTSLGRRVKSYFNKSGCWDDGQERVFVLPFQGKRMIEGNEERYVYRIRPELKAALEELDLSEFNPYYDEKTGEVDEMNTIEFPKNTILYGPPGTGKTYSSAIYAVAICDKLEVETVKNMDYGVVMNRYKELMNEERVAFTTFHQSYGYEEFIEGIKPVISDGDSGISYTIEDGIFKDFCNNAKMPKSSLVDHNAKIWKVVLKSGELVSNNTVKFDCWNHGKIMFDWKMPEDHIGTYTYNQINHFKEKMNIGDVVVSYAGSGTDIDAIGIVTGDAEYDESQPSYRWSRKVNWLEYNHVRNIKEFNGSKFFDNDQLQNLKRVSISSLLSLVEPETKAESDKNYVFVIDEINRGNISKIFGEFITLIEDTKRAGMAEEASAILPYSGEAFAVPSNVHILGTMNTADRSIALMDTALRRRFQFVEMMPDTNVLRAIGADKVEDLDVAKMLEVINERITFLYDREHTIGHAFFTKLAKNPTIETLKEIFGKSVIPLLQEYFYEDYQKIQLVLGDNGKTDESLKFIKDEEVKVRDIFKGNADDVIDLPEKKYSVNTEAFSKLDSYKEIF